MYSFRPCRCLKTNLRLWSPSYWWITALISHFRTNMKRRHYSCAGIPGSEKWCCLAVAVLQHQNGEYSPSRPPLPSSPPALPPSPRPPSPLPPKKEIWLVQIYCWEYSVSVPGWESLNSIIQIVLLDAVTNSTLIFFFFVGLLHQSRPLNRKMVPLQIM